MRSSPSAMKRQEGKTWNFLDYKSSSRLALTSDVNAGRAEEEEKRGSSPAAGGQSELEPSSRFSRANVTKKREG